MSYDTGTGTYRPGAWEHPLDPPNVLPLNPPHSDTAELQETLDAAMWLAFALTGALGAAIAWGWLRGRRARR